jgi:SPX domain protein involved in polyphosphate accumulation
MSLSSTDTFRFERKFAIPQHVEYGLDILIKKNFFCFREIFQPRCVNNIYFDSPTFRFYHENVEGVSNRKKARIRWYGDLNTRIEKPILEFKNKTGLTGIKDSFPLKIFDFKDLFEPSARENIFLNSRLPVAEMQLMLSLKPTLINRYDRTYYLSGNQKFRITIDRNVKYYSPSSPIWIQHRGFRDPIHTILELKYNQIYQDESSDVTQSFPFRLSKNSKYVRGVKLIMDLEEH